MKRRLDLTIVPSTRNPEVLSVRLHENEETALAFQVALTETGFKPGDRAVLVSEEWLRAQELALAAWIQEYERGDL